MPLRGRCVVIGGVAASVVGRSVTETVRVVLRIEGTPAVLPANWRPDLLILSYERLVPEAPWRWQAFLSGEDLLGDGQSITLTDDPETPEYVRALARAYAPAEGRLT